MVRCTFVSNAGNFKLWGFYREAWNDSLPTWDLITWSSKKFLKSVQTKLFLPHVADAYLEPCRTSKMEVFAKIVRGFLEIPEN